VLDDAGENVGRDAVRVVLLADVLALCIHVGVYADALEDAATTKCVKKYLKGLERGHTSPFQFFLGLTHCHQLLNGRILPLGAYPPNNITIHISVHVSECRAGARVYPLGWRGELGRGRNVEIHCGE